MQEKITHDRLQQDCVTWLWNTYPETRRNCWHSPNEFPPEKGESVKSISYIKKQSHRKAIGVLKGVTDLVFYFGGILYMFDIKMPGDRLSEDQLSFIEANVKQGGLFFEINNFEQFCTIINKYLSL